MSLAFGKTQQGHRGTLVIKRGVFPTELVTMELHGWKPIFISASEHTGALNLVSSAKQLRASGAISAAQSAGRPKSCQKKHLIPTDTERCYYLLLSETSKLLYSAKKNVLGLSNYFTSDLKISPLLGVFLAEGSDCNRIRQYVSSCQVTEC